jgi:ABC-2 type transport system permease protein
MKTLPVSYHFQLAAKITLAGVLGLIGTCLGLGVAVPVLGLPGHLALLGLIVLPGASTLPHLAGIFFELNWPKLNWDNEQRAVKQNMNVLYGMIVSVVAAALAIALVITLQPGLPATLVLLTAGPLGISLILALMLRTWIPRRMRNIQG